MQTTTADLTGGRSTGGAGRARLGPLEPTGIGRSQDEPPGFGGLHEIHTPFPRRPPTDPNGPPMTPVTPPRRRAVGRALAKGAAELAAGLPRLDVADRRGQRALDRWFASWSEQLRGLPRRRVDRARARACRRSGRPRRHWQQTIAADLAAIDHLVGALGDALGIVGDGSRRPHRVVGSGRRRSPSSSPCSCAARCPSTAASRRRTRADLSAGESQGGSTEALSGSSATWRAHRAEPARPARAGPERAGRAGRRPGRRRRGGGGWLDRSGCPMWRRRRPDDGRVAHSTKVGCPGSSPATASPRARRGQVRARSGRRSGSPRSPADETWSRHVVGVLDEACWYAVDVPAGADPSDGAAVDLGRYHGRAGEDAWLAAGRAVQLVEWDRTHRYCGRCGTPTEPAARERAMRCPACGLPPSLGWRRR